MGPYEKIAHDGKTVDAITGAALDDTEAALGYRLSITQGSYNPGGVGASGGTHDRGGVVDLKEWDYENKVRELRRVGFAAWHRPELWRSGVRIWPGHIHAVLIGNKLLAPAARAQVLDYLAGRNGLADKGPDNGPRNFVSARYRWQRGTAKITRARVLIEKAELLLSTGIRGYRVGKTRARLRDALRKLPK